ncbi:hypothetical protein SAMN05192568_1002121 [Methylobacterium pseudosasicola]|uniref:Uncharacterized protein n=1 Tax=Methylobacterium pseudosasicola TaxID=582667 RepID=A0A1I4G0A0_9HYPH|nr:hypothetical protein SAMN05192568_1002121 [Methylobacterium pseudosasicola]
MPAGAMGGADGGGWPRSDDAVGGGRIDGSLVSPHRQHREASSETLRSEIARRPGLLRYARNDEAGGYQPSPTSTATGYP